MKSPKVREFLQIMKWSNFLKNLWIKTGVLETLLSNIYQSHSNRNNCTLHEIYKLRET